MEIIVIKLNRPRGAITEGKAVYEYDEDGEEFRAYISIGRTYYSEFQTCSPGSREISSTFEWDEENGPRGADAGSIPHRTPILSLEDWVAWLKEYVACLDPRDAIRAYNETIYQPVIDLPKRTIGVTVDADQWAFVKSHPEINLSGCVRKMIDGLRASGDE